MWDEEEEPGDKQIHLLSNSLLHRVPSHLLIATAYSHRCKLSSLQTLGQIQHFHELVIISFYTHWFSKCIGRAENVIIVLLQFFFLMKKCRHRIQAGLRIVNILSMHVAEPEQNLLYCVKNQATEECIDYDIIHFDIRHVQITQKYIFKTTFQIFTTKASPSP